MNDMLLIPLTSLGTISLLAIYWTLWKIRGELTQGREKLNSDLSEVRKLLESKTGK